MALIGEVWHTSAMREKEVELLHIGDQYRKAIERYYLSGPRLYPRNLSDLIQDPRQPGTVRHLRKLYPDPITGTNEWGLVKAADGGIAGVHSLSEERPLKSAGFRVRDASFEGTARYADWKFVFAPQQAPQPGSLKPAPGGSTPAAATPGNVPMGGLTPGGAASGGTPPGAPLTGN